MEIFGLILLIAGGVLWFVRRSQDLRSKHLKLARATQIGELKTVATAVAQEIGSGDWRDYVVLWGTVEAENPLTSPMKNVPCVYYSNQVVREYEETIYEQDSTGKTISRTQRGSETISQEQQHIPFYLVDNSSERALVNPDGADIEAVEVLNEFRPGSPAGGLISFGGFSLALGEMGGGGSRRTLGYRYRESIVPMGRPITVLGMASDRTGDITLEQPNSPQPFIISPKSQESLTKAATQNARMAFWAMVGCLGVGFGVLLWAIVA